MNASWKFVMLLAALGCVLVVGTAHSDEEEPQAESAPRASDPYAVPDGDEAELLSFIDKMQQQRPQGSSRSAMIADLTRIQKSILEAADKVLGGEPSEEGRVTANRAKLASLVMLTRLGDADAKDAFRKLAEELRNDPSPELAREAGFMFLNAKAAEVLQQGDEEKVNALVAEVKDFIMAAEPDLAGLRLAFPLAQALEQAGHTDQAREAFKTYAEFYSASDDRQLADIGQKLHGSARRLDLIGNPLKLEGTLVDGKPFDWSAYSGKVVLVDFWATWCGPCRAELPNVLENYDRYHEQGFEVVGISLDDNREAVEEFVAEHKIPWANLFSDDPEATGWNHPMAEHYGITAIPAVMLVNRDGNVVSLNARGPNLGRQLDELFGSASEEK